MPETLTDVDELREQFKMEARRLPNLHHMLVRTTRAHLEKAPAEIWPGMIVEAYARFDEPPIQHWRRAEDWHRWMSLPGHDDQIGRMKSPSIGDQPEDIFYQACLYGDQAEERSFDLLASRASRWLESQAQGLTALRVAEPLADDSVWRWLLTIHQFAERGLLPLASAKRQYWRHAFSVDSRIVERLTNGRPDNIVADAIAHGFSDEEARALFDHWFSLLKPDVYATSAMTIAAIVNASQSAPPNATAPKTIPLNLLREKTGLKTSAFSQAVVDAGLGATKQGGKNRRFSLHEAEVVLNYLAENSPTTAIRDTCKASLKSLYNRVIAK